MWDKNNRDQSISVMSNAHLHHLCLWFLLYGERRTFSTSEVMCYIFHAAMCSLVLEDDSPAPCPLDGTEPRAISSCSRVPCLVQRCPILRTTTWTLSCDRCARLLATGGAGASHGGHRQPRHV